MPGYIQDKVGEEDWVAGHGKATQRFGGDINPLGDWTEYNPNREHQQKNGLETMNCSNFATHNALIALANYLNLPFPKDASERYSGVMTGTTRDGNSPHNVIEKIRSLAGVLPEDKLPWTEQRSWDEYYAPNPMDEALVKEAQSVLKNVVIGHEWIFNGPKADKHDILKKYLKRGTVCVSVDAWNKKGKYYVKPEGGPDNHWVWLVRYDGDVPIIRDQYPQFEKRLAPDYDFVCAKVYFMKKNENGIAPNILSYFVWQLTNALKKLWLGFSR